MTSLLEVLFVKHTMQVSQQAQLLIFPSWKSKWKLPNQLCMKCV